MTDLDDLDGYVFEAWRPGGVWHTLAIGSRDFTTELCARAADMNPHTTMRVRAYATTADGGTGVILSRGPRLTQEP